MAIDSMRILTDSAGHLWKRLDSYGSLEALCTGGCFEEWRRSSSHPRALSQIEELQLRRDYDRLYRLLGQIETLVKSKSRAIEIVRARATR